MRYRDVGSCPENAKVCTAAGKVAGLLPPGALDNVQIVIRAVRVPGGVI